MNITIEKNLLPIGEKAIDRYTISNSNKISISVLNYGAIISSVKVPDKNGNSENIVLGFEDVSNYICEEYLSNYPYWGAVCGRCANRIGEGKFILDGKEIQLEKNHNGSHLHGGIEGFDKKFWRVAVKEGKDHISLIMSYTSVDGEEHYPGRLKVDVIYTLAENDTFSIAYRATTDKPTPVNLTNHTYFNLTGNGTDIARMTIKVNASHFTPLNDKLVPTGEIIVTTGTKYDLQEPVTFEEGFKELPEGYDFNYILKDKGYLKTAAFITDPITGRKLKVVTSQPAIQVYSGYWCPRICDIGGRLSGVALETQHYPDAPNKPNFPGIILRPKTTYRQITIWKF
ncbi:MAG: galactose mutarotase [Bacteroidales bacterium]|nr:galactose mutarotase [Bacteroidales bacterium]